jgi:hypothetical protein
MEHMEFDPETGRIIKGFGQSLLQPNEQGP